MKVPMRKKRIKLRLREKKRDMSRGMLKEI